VIRALEDLGYYSVDNLPIELIPKFAELTRDSATVRCAALVVDVREGEALKSFPALYARIRRSIPTKLIFLEADDATLVRRFSEPRRPHPLGTNRSVQRSIQSERRKLGPIRALADIIIDTSKFNVHDLRETIVEKFRGEREESKIVVYVTSFGYRHGVPRQRPGSISASACPNYIPAFKELTPARNRTTSARSTDHEFIRRIRSAIFATYYIREGKALTIAFGCTGSHHRSVMIAEQIHKALAHAGYRVSRITRTSPSRFVRHFQLAIYRRPSKLHNTSMPSRSPRSTPSPINLSPAIRPRFACCRRRATRRGCRPSPAR
jgi:UPF0042 nucleotide-binding protein